MNLYMRAKLRAFRTEIKYGLAGAIILGGLFWLSQSGLLAGVEDHLSGIMDEAVTFGLIGLAIGAFVSNAVVLISIPFTLVAVTFFLVQDSSLTDIVAFALMTGIGGGLGKLFSYTVAKSIAARVDSLGDSPLFRWIERLVRTHPHLAPLIVFFGIVAALPNDIVLLPLALIRYPVRRIALPVILAKIVHNTGLGLVFVYIIGLTDDALTPAVKIDLTFGIIVITILAVLYQIEKSRLETATQRITIGSR